MLVVDSKNLDPHWNLAAEEVLMDLISSHSSILFLWQFQDSVIFGKNQNPWRECQFKKCNLENIRLARRLSGGGTVFQDIGNLNYSLFVPRTNFNEQEQLKWVCSVLAILGVSTKIMNKTNIMVNGYKVSGNAFCIRKQGVLHHGTLLISSNLARLRSVLVPSEERISTHAIRSLPAQVKNLSTLAASIHLSNTKQALISQFSQTRQARPLIVDAEEFLNKEIAHTYARYSSWEWCYGYTPTFEIVLTPLYKGCVFPLGLKIVKARVSSLKKLSHTVDSEAVQVMEQLLVGCSFSSNKLVDKLNACKDSRYADLLRSLIIYFEEKGY